MAEQQFGQLTAQGARLLRMAREEIVRHPETFDMSNWDCGTTACIAGHVVRAAVMEGLKTNECSHTSVNACSLLGFTQQDGMGATPLHPLTVLFSPLGWFRRFSGNIKETQTGENAAIWINEFLWSQGFPPDEMVGGEEV